MTQDNAGGLIEIDSLSKEIECIICLDTANDPRMCIHCSAIVCTKCIESWIKKKNLCPKCSNSVQQKDFVKCHLVNRLIDFIEESKTHNCCIHRQEKRRVYCSTCQNYICSECILINNQHINHNYKNINEDYKQILTLNHKLIDFIRERYKQNQEKLRSIELNIQMLLNNRDQQTIELLIKETEQNKQICNDAIKNDQLIINDVEKRLRESKDLSDQEDILQILQQHIPSDGK